MKTFMRLSFAVGLLMAFAAWAEPATEYMQANIPFVFVFAGEDFAPGSYRIGADDNGLIVVEKRNRSAMALASPSHNQQQDAGLRFQDREGKKYLVGVTLPGTGQHAVVIGALRQ